MSFSYWPTEVKRKHNITSGTCITLAAAFGVTAWRPYDDIGWQPTKDMHLQSLDLARCPFPPYCLHWSSDGDCRWRRSNGCRVIRETPCPACIASGRDPR